MSSVSGFLDYVYSGEILILFNTLVVDGLDVLFGKILWFMHACFGFFSSSFFSFC